MSRARRRDRRVYLYRHPLLFTLLSVTRRRPVVRIGRTVVVHGTDAYRDALTRLPLDRVAAGTTGGAARDLGAADLLFDQDGGAHRGARRSLAADLDAAGVQRLRPVWRGVLERRFAPLAAGATVDVVDVAAEIAAVTTCALLRVQVDPARLARAARDAAAAVARDHLPRVRRGRPAGAEAAARLAALLGGDGLAAMLAVTAVNTTVAAVPRAVAWCADDDLWAAAGAGEGPVLVRELLRVVAPSPLLPRAAGADGRLDGCPVRAGDRLVLVARHAAGAHRSGPDPHHPAPPGVAQLVFGAGAHACPGAGLARAQLADVLRALAPYRPTVVTARADRRSALPGWARLVVRAGAVVGTGPGGRAAGADPHPGGAARAGGADPHPGGA